MIAHNAKFDAKWVRHHLGTELGGIYDTYLASLLISAGEGERRHGLADVVQFFLGRTLDKTEQVSDWAADDLSVSQIEYAARDAAIMPEVHAKLEERIVGDGLTDVLRLENECVMPIAEMELNGFYLDESRSARAARQGQGRTGHGRKRTSGYALGRCRTGFALWPD